MKFKKMLFVFLLAVGANSCAMHDQNLESKIDDGGLTTSESVATSEDVVEIIVPKIGCRKTYGCQVYFACLDRYMQETGDTNLFRAPDEVKDPETLKILTSFLFTHVSYPFTKENGDLIVPRLNDKSQRRGLPDISDNLKFKKVKEVVELFEGESLSSAQLNETFDIMNNGYCVASTQQPKKSSTSPLQNLHNRIENQVAISDDTPSSATVVHGLNHLAVDLEDDTQWFKSVQSQFKQANQYRHFCTSKKRYPAAYPRFTKDGKAQ